MIEVVVMLDAKKKATRIVVEVRSQVAYIREKMAASADLFNLYRVL